MVSHLGFYTDRAGKAAHLSLHGVRGVCSNAHSITGFWRFLNLRKLYHIVFSKQCGHKQFVDIADLEQKWKSLCLPREKLRALIQLDPCEHRIEWIKFLALGCSMLGGVRT